MAKCPRCDSPANPTGKEWEYRYFHVKQYICSECGKKYMEYYKGGVLSHTIPMDAGTPSEKVLRLLRKTKILSCEEISKKTDLKISEVLNVLEELELAGAIQRYG